MIHNVSDVEVTITLQENISRFNEIDYDSQDGKIAIQENEIKVPAYTTVILKED